MKVSVSATFLLPRLFLAHHLSYPRYPVDVSRQDHWDGTAPGESQPRPVWLPHRGYRALRVVRGGSWLPSVQASRTANRNPLELGYRNPNLGFRGRFRSVQQPT